MKRSTSIHPACLYLLRVSQRSEVISVVNCFTHEQIKELTPLETMTKIFTEHGKTAENLCHLGRSVQVLTYGVGSVTLLRLILAMQSVFH